jgi:hypothetical protein
MKLYQHYKGGLYIVPGEERAIDATNDTPRGDRAVVVYYSIPEEKAFVRDAYEFNENVEHKGKTGPRFRFIADAADIMPNGGHP